MEFGEEIARRIYDMATLTLRSCRFSCPYVHCFWVVDIERIVRIGVKHRQLGDGILLLRPLWYRA